MDKQKEGPKKTMDITRMAREKISPLALEKKMKSRTDNRIPKNSMAFSVSTPLEKSELFDLEEEEPGSSPFKKPM